MKRNRLLIIIIILAAAISLMAVLRGSPFVDRSLCVGCEDCARACPVNAISLDDSKAWIDQQTCIDCRLCVKSCQYRAIRAPQ